MSINFTFYKTIDLYLHSKKHFILKPVLVKNVCIVFLTYANVNLTLIVLFKYFVLNFILYSTFLSVKIIQFMGK